MLPSTFWVLEGSATMVGYPFALLHVAITQALKFSKWTFGQSLTLNPVYVFYSCDVRMLFTHSQHSPVLHCNNTSHQMDECAPPNYHIHCVWKFWCWSVTVSEEGSLQKDVKVHFLHKEVGSWWRCPSKVICNSVIFTINSDKHSSCCLLCVLPQLCQPGRGTPVKKNHILLVKYIWIVVWEYKQLNLLAVTSFFRYQEINYRMMDWDVSQDKMISFMYNINMMERLPFYCLLNMSWWCDAQTWLGSRITP